MDEFSDFKSAIGQVKKLKPQNKINLKKNKQDSKSIQTRRDAATEEVHSEVNHLSGDHVEMVKPYDTLSYKKDGLQDGVYKKFRLGKYQLDARLDLHNKTVEQARKDVYRFIDDAKRYDLRTLIIVHGKGEQESTPALLKSWVNTWLPEFDDILAFHSAMQMHGGTGAVYVMLRKSERKKQETRELHNIKPDYNL